MQHGIQSGHNIRARERLLPGSHLVQHDTERKNIAAWIQPFAARLLGRHVYGGAGNHSHSGQRIFNRCIGFGGKLLVPRQLRQSEVEDFGLPVFRQKNVGWFYVAMNDALRVGRRQSVGCLYRDLEDLIQIHGLAPDALLQALTLELFHHDKGMAIIVLNIVDRADVGMIQLRCSSRLALETVERLAISKEIFGNELQRDVAAQADVLGLIHDSHATATEFSQNAVVGDRLTNHGQACSYRR